MNHLGFTAQIDSVGRIVIPKQLRKKFGIGEKSLVNISTTENGIILTKFQPGCVICSSEDNLIEYKGQFICNNCIEELKKVSK